MDYISRDDVLRKFIEGDGHDDDRFTEGYNFAVQEYREKVKNMPAADVQPVKRGEWGKRAYDRLQCSYCGKCEDVATDFCPNCGARMDE